MPIVIEDYNPDWPKFYEEEKERIVGAIGHLLAGIEHIGSTSVPGLAAKPIVDIMPAVRSEADLDLTIAPMRALGYEYVSKYEEVLPFRRLFVKRRPSHPRSFNVHVVPHGGDWWVNDRAFRDYLRAHPETARDYEKLKRSLAPRFDNANDYAVAKTEFIQAIKAKARGVTGSL